MRTLKEIFPYKYMGGGVFRLKDVPKDVVAPILHGDEAIKFLFAEMLKEFEKEREK